MRHTRRAILTAATGTLVSSSGCVEEVKREAWELRNPQPEIQTSLGGMSHEPYVKGQPTSEDVPATSGALATEPAQVDDLVLWDKLDSRYREFTPGEQFLSIVVGALQAGYGLTSSEPARLEDSTLKYRTEPYQAFKSGPEDPEYSYDYTFTLWNLRGLEPPEDITVSFENATPTATASESRMDYGDTAEDT